MSEKAEIIKARVTMQDVVGGYFPHPPPRHGRIPCPIHGGKNYNLSFRDKVFKCYVCGEGGDVIRFVSKCFGLNFQEAIHKISRDFGLGLDNGKLGRPDIERLQNEAERRRKEQEQQQAERDAAEARYHAALDRWVAADRALRGGNHGEPEHDAALRNAAKATYLLDMEEIKLARIRGFEP